MDKKLYRSAENSKICGVCGGIGEYFGIDPNIIRIAWVILSIIFILLGVILYVACVFILPKNGETQSTRTSSNEEDNYSNMDDDDEIIQF